MGRKIFVSYKYSDNQVKNLCSGEDSTVRDYVTQFEEVLDASDNIYKGEDDGEDLSNLSDETIWQKLKDRIYDSSTTVVFISPGMRENEREDKDQWIPWEISYSLKEVSRNNTNGDAVTSRSNAMVAVVLPDENGDYSYYLEKKNCCSNGCVLHHIEKLFSIIKNNKFNFKDGNKEKCGAGSIVWHGESSYIEAVRWDNFISNYKKYIEAACARQDNIEDYEICKDV
jgi:hypothetical protein